MGFAYYFGNIFPSFFEADVAWLRFYNFSLTAGQVTAIFAVIVLTYINYVGARLGSIVQVLLTLLSIVTICVFLAIAFAVPKPQTLTLSFVNPPDFSKFSLAMIPILWDILRLV